jgi:hypothetical protein
MQCRVFHFTSLAALVISIVLRSLRKIIQLLRSRMVVATSLHHEA